MSQGTAGARYDEAACAARWAAWLAPRTGHPLEDLTIELAEYLRIPRADVEAQLAHATERFTEEWRARVPDPADTRSVQAFYNESRTELFDLARWHGEDRIHYRTLMCLDLASARSGREALDYGSGIGSDALVLGLNGFHVTLADISDPLMAFASWRCRRRGLDVELIDLKRQRLPARRYDAVLCFDVLEHIHRPVKTFKAIGRATRPGGLVFVHAPFGPDPDRPMHVVHEDVISPRIRAAGFNWRGDLERVFPAWLWHPRVYESFESTALDRLAYEAYDVWLKGPMGDALARMYRRLIPRRA